MTADMQLKVLREHSRSEMFFAVARVPGSTRLLLGASDGKIYDVDGDSEKLEPKTIEGHSSFVTGVAVTDSRIVSGSYDCSLVWRNLHGNEVIRQVNDAHGRWIRKVIASPDNRFVASVGDDMVCRVWESHEGKLVHELRGHEPKTPHHFPSMLYTCAFSPDSQRLATADKTGRICLWDASSGQPLRVIEATGFYTWDPKQRIHSIGGTRALAFSPDGKLLAAGGIGTIGNIDHLDGPARVELFEVETGTSLHTFSGETKGMVEQLIFHPSMPVLIAMGGDNGGFWQTYDVVEKKTIRSDKAPMHIYAAELSDDAKKVYSVGHGKMVVWEAVL